MNKYHKLIQKLQDMHGQTVQLDSEGVEFFAQQIENFIRQRGSNELDGELLHFIVQLVLNESRKKTVEEILDYLQDEINR